jgi:hypothetical protein
LAAGGPESAKGTIWSSSLYITNTGTVISLSLSVAGGRIPLKRGIRNSAFPAPQFSGAVPPFR